MPAHLRVNLMLLVLTLVLCSVLYPLALLAIALGVFPANASGSLVFARDGTPIGSPLIAQEFRGDEWFHPRPSAVNWNAAGSGGSNWAASNPQLRERAEKILQARTEAGPLPADAVTASGSGLDPHITLRNAQGQTDRIVKAWASKTGRTSTDIRTTVEAILAGTAYRPLGGLAGGEPIVNVLMVNRTMKQHPDLTVNGR